jgi:hypothetical protein
LLSSVYPIYKLQLWSILSRPTKNMLRAWKTQWIPFKTYQIPPHPKLPSFIFHCHASHKGVASEIKSRFDYYLQIKFTFLLNIDARNVFLCMLD